MFGAVLNSIPVSLEISAATLTSKPFFVLRPCIACQCFRTPSSHEGTHSADGSTTLGKETETRQSVLDTVDAVGQLLDIAAELLAESQGGRILKEKCQESSNLLSPMFYLQMGAANLDDVFKLLRLCVEGIAQLSDGRKE